MAAYWEIAAHSAYNMILVQVSNCQFSFSHFGFWSGNFFLTAPFPDHCLLVPFLARLYESTGRAIAVTSASASVSASASALALASALLKC